MKERERRRANEQQVGASNACGGKTGEREELRGDGEAENGKAIVVGFGRNIRRSETLSAM